MEVHKQNNHDDYDDDGYNKYHDDNGKLHVIVPLWRACAPAMPDVGSQGTGNEATYDCHCDCQCCHLLVNSLRL